MFQHRRGEKLAGLSRVNRRNLLTTSLDELQHSAISARLERASIGGPVASKPKSVSAGMGDLLTSDGGKHDYDWLLTPPGTPSGESKPSLLALAPVPTATARAPTTTRSGSVTRSSRIPGSQTETTIPVKTARSVSTSRPSTSSSFLSGSQASKSILNTSSMSVGSRPSTPTRRPVAPSSQSRPSTPSRTKPPALSSRPSTPTSKPQIPSTVKPSPVKPTTTPPAKGTASRPSTPTRTASRSSTPSRRPSTETLATPSPPIVRSPVPTTRSPALASRARSPSPRPHSRQPLSVHDFPKEAPPNLRATAADRPSSATRSRPGSSYSTHSTEYTSNGGGTVRRPSPVRGRENCVTRERMLVNGYGSGHMENTGIRAPVSRPPSSTMDNGGFGRTISKKSMDMAIRHMDIRHSTGNIRSLAGSSIFPQSIRSTTSKIRSSSLPDNQTPHRTSNNKILENGNAGNISDYENGKDRSHIVDLIAERLAVKLKEAEKMKETDLSISTRYDSFLLKEDLKNTEWLHSVDDQSPIFDHRFEQLPEPFGS